MKRSDPGGFWLLLLGLLVLLPSIWKETSITGGDEHRISFRTALETRDADQWLIPTYEGEPRLRKPPLLYWVLTATAEFLGPSLFNFRIWGVLCGALLAIFTARWGQRLFSADPVLTFVILISCLGLATESRRAMLDIPMALFLVLALERWGNCMKDARGRDAVFAGLYLAIAALIKPTAIYFFAAAIPVMAWLQPREKGLVLAAKRLSGLPLMLATFCLLFLPWWLYVYSIYPDLLQSRLDEQVQNREISFLRWDSIPPLIGGWLGLVAPWSFALIFAVLRFLRRPEEGTNPPERWLAVWVVIASVPFLFMKTFERYLIPLLPAFAILISTYLDSLKPIPVAPAPFGGGIHPRSAGTFCDAVHVFHYCTSAIVSDTRNPVHRLPNGTANRHRQHSIVGRPDLELLSWYFDSQCRNRRRPASLARDSQGFALSGGGTACTVAGRAGATADSQDCG